VLAGVDAPYGQEAGDDSRLAEGSRFRSYRWQEDYLRLSHKTAPLSDYERIKYIHLGDAPRTISTLGASCAIAFTTTAHICSD
jgi:hypothetical protein